MNARLVAAVGVAAACGYVAATVRLRRRVAAAFRFATTDPLTGIANRAGLSAVADRLIACHRPVVVLVDLVGFKAINDTHGHTAGDLVLTTIAARLAESAGPTGIAARLGGDEFALIATPTVPLPQWLGSLHTHLTSPVDYRGHRVTVGATLGAVLADRSAPAALWLHRADTAMYAARSRRRTFAILTDFTGAGTPPARPAHRTRDMSRPASHLATAAERSAA